MKLSYRGVHYKNEPSTLEVTEGEIVGRYQDQQRQSGYVRHIPEPLKLKNRGVAYRTSQSSSAVQTVAPLALCVLPPRMFPPATGVKFYSVDTVSRGLEIRSETALPPIAF